MLEETEFNRILEEKQIFTVYQPIISLKERRVIGMEALSRGIGKNGVIPPDKLFKSSRFYNKVLDFDRLCRTNAVKDFSGERSLKEKILFLNFDPAILNKVTIGSRWMEKLVIEYGIDPGSVAIEIVESEVDSRKSLIDFTNLYRDLGFLIVLDDFGADYSNLSRVMDLKPDIIKIDKKIVNGVSKEYYKKVIISSIVNFSNKTGVLTLAEGVENLDDIMTCAELGVDFYQGFYFAKPERINSKLDEKCENLIVDASDKTSDYLSEKYVKNLNITKSFEKISNYYIEKLKELDKEELDEFFVNGTEFCDNVQCLYLLDSKGVQISGTNCHITFEHNRLFSPSSKGADHSLKEYFYQMTNHNTDMYLTDPYISLATGNICRTMSKKFYDSLNREVILCIDFI